MGPPLQHSTLAAKTATLIKPPALDKCCFASGVLQAVDDCAGQLQVLDNQLAWSDEQKAVLSVRRAL